MGGRRREESPSDSQFPSPEILLSGGEDSVLHMNSLKNAQHCMIKCPKEGADDNGF